VLAASLAYSSILNMDAVRSSETSAIFYRLYKVTFQKLVLHIKVLEYIKIYIYDVPIFHMKSAFEGNR
jgi:hypothetical protein